MQAGIATRGTGHAHSQRYGARTCVLLLALSAAVLMAGCASRTKPAPITHLSTEDVRKPAQRVEPTAVATTATTTAVASHTVAVGDTLYSIARQHGATVASLVQLNQIENPDVLHVGQVLHLRAPSTATPVTPPVQSSTGATPVVRTQTTATTRGATPDTQVSSTPTSRTTPPTTTPSRNTSAPRASDANLIRWDWPASGHVLKTFNVNTKGIDLEGKIGDPVKAAADGTVMYAGNGVRGLGNLILLGHSDGFISAYAHNQVLLVKTGQTIKRGTQIASIGQSDTTSPRLHFEIRRRGTPVNPLSYLPTR